MYFPLRAIRETAFDQLQCLFQWDFRCGGRLPGKCEKTNAKVTDMFTNGVVPMRSRPYHVGNENGGDSVEAHVDRAAAARTRVVVTVECLRLPVNWVNNETLPRLHSGKHRLVHLQASGLSVFCFLTSS